MSGPDQVYVRTQDGSVLQGPASQLQGAIDAGAQPITTEEAQAAQNTEKYAGLGHTLAATGIGAANMLTLGLGKGLAADIGGDETRQYIQGVTQAHPMAEHVGEAAGIAIPALLSGGSSLAAEGGEGLGLVGGLGRAAMAPTEALSGLGGLGEAAVRGVLPEAESGLGKAAVNVAGLGGRGAIEGAALGANTTWSDSQIDNHPLTAELLLAGMKKGALYGGALGVGLGAAGEALGGLGRAVGGRLTEGSDTVGELGLRATGARLPEVRRLTDKGIDPQSIGRFVVDELPQYADKPFMTMSKEEMRDAATQAVKAAGERIGSGIDELSAIAERQGIRPNVNQIVSRVDQEIITPLRRLPGFESEVSQLEKYSASFAEKGESATFRDLNDFRKALDKKIFKGGKAPPPDSVLDELWNARRIIEDEAEKQGGSVAGADWLQRYKGNKAYFAKAKEAEYIAGKGTERQTGRNMVGLSDMIAAGAGFAHAGPVGLLAGAAHHMVKEYGTQFAADILNRAQGLNALKAMAGKTSAQLDSGISKFLGSAQERAITAATTATVASSRENFRSASKRVQDAASSPEALQAHIAPTVPDATVAPRLGPLMAQKHAAALSWLQAQIPKGPPLSPLVPTVTGEPSRAKTAAWMAKDAVYKDPVGTILKHLGKGTLTHDHVAALTNMFPELKQEMGQRAMLQISELAAKNKLPPARKLRALGLLLGIPADASQTKSFVTSQQSLYASQDSAASQAAGSPPSASRNQRGARPSLASGEDELDAQS